MSKSALFCGVAFSFGLMVAACSTDANRMPDAMATVPVVAPPSPVRLTTLLFTSGREGELETCGCTMTSLGGVDREKNLIDHWKLVPNEFFSVVAGPTFLPVKHTSSQAKHFLGKTKFVTDAFNHLGVTVVAPAVSDLELGEKNLKEIAAQAKFKFVSSDIYSGKNPLFSPFFTWSGPQGKITVVVLSAVNSVAPKKGFRLKAPKEALKLAVEAAGSDPGMIVLVTSLEPNKVRPLLKDFPQIHIVLDATPSEEPYTPTLETASLLWVHPETRGREIARFDFDLSKNYPELYNENMSSTAGSRIFQFENWMKEANTAKTTATPKARKEIEAQIAHYKKEIEAATRKMPADVSKAMPFTYEMAFVEKSYSKPENELTKIIRSYKTSLRDTAVSAEATE